MEDEYGHGYHPGEGHEDSLRQIGIMFLLKWFLGSTKYNGSTIRQAENKKLRERIEPYSSFVYSKLPRPKEEPPYVPKVSYSDDELNFFIDEILTMMGREAMASATRASAKLEKDLAEKLNKHNEQSNNLKKACGSAADKSTRQEL